jgi:TPR repeat protein
VVLVALGLIQARAGDEKLDKQFIEATVKAAESGDAVAQCALGACFEGGTGMLTDYEEAAKWYRRAAVQGDAMGQYSLGACYERGRGVDQDFKEAAKWYTQAAEQGYLRARLKLGAFYAEGTGVAEDLAQAHRWYERAAEKGDEAARAALRKLEKRMTKAELASSKHPPTGFAFSASVAASEPFPTSSNTPPTSSSSPQAVGAGFFITDSGFLIASARLVKQADRIELLTRVGRVAAKVVKVDLTDDLALLKAEGKFTPLLLAPSRAIRSGARVTLAVLPNHLNAYTFHPSPGEITDLSGPRDDPHFFQVAVSLNPGESGGALTDSGGNVIGVLVSPMATPSGLPKAIQCALKSSFLLAFLESVPEVAGLLTNPHPAAADSQTTVEPLPDASALVLIY